MRTVLFAALAIALAGCPQGPEGPDATFPADLGLGPPIEDGGVSDGGAAPPIAVAYQLDVAHSGAQAGAALAPPLTERWSVDLGGPISYPLVAGGRVFVVVGGATTHLYALSADRGGPAFGPIALSGTWAAAALDGGSVFVLDAGGVLRAIDASNGTQRWQHPLPGGSATAAPIASGGMVYASGAGAVLGLDEASGAVRFTAQVAGGPPALSPGALLVTGGCGQAWALSPQTGAQIWHHAVACGSAGGVTPLYAAGRLFVRDPMGDVILDARSGAAIGTFTAGPAPAVDGPVGVFLQGSELRAIEVANGQVLWTFTGDGTLRSAPIVAGGFVYIGSGNGLLYALDEVSGQLAWTQPLGVGLDAPDETDGSRPLPGLAVGEDLLVVPAGHRLFAFSN